MNSFFDDLLSAIKRIPQITRESVNRMRDYFKKSLDRDNNHDKDEQGEGRE